MLPKKHLCIRLFITRCVGLLLFTLGPALFAEDSRPVDTVGRLGVGLANGSLATTDQALNAALISLPGYVIQPALDVGLYKHWLFTMESQLRMLKWDAPKLAATIQDPALTASGTLGFHFRQGPLELGILTGLNESALIVAAPTSSRVLVQNVMMPFVGFRFGLNGRFRRFYTRIEISYLLDLPTTSDRISFGVSQSGRLLINGQLGVGRWREWLRFSAGLGLQNVNTTLGHENAVLLQFGISIGRIWGQRPRPPGT